MTKQTQNGALLIYNGVKSIYSEVLLSAME